MRKLAFLALRLTLLPFVFREVLQRNKVTILVYHAPTPQVFDAKIGVFGRLYNIVPLSAYVQARRTGDFSKLPPEALFVTLNDGHRSKFALKQVVERYNVPITIFLCSGGTRRRFSSLHERSPALVQRLKTVPDDEGLADLCLFRLRRICVPDNADRRELLVKASGLWGEIKVVLDALRRRVHDAKARPGATVRLLVLDFRQKRTPASSGRP